MLVKCEDQTKAQLKLHKSPTQVSSLISPLNVVAQTMSTVYSKTFENSRHNDRVYQF